VSTESATGTAPSGEPVEQVARESTDGMNDVGSETTSDESRNENGERPEGGERAEGGESRRRGRGRDRNRRERSPEGGSDNVAGTQEGLIQSGPLAADAYQGAVQNAGEPMAYAAAPAAALTAREEPAPVIVEPFRPVEAQQNAESVVAPVAMGTARGADATPTQSAAVATVVEPAEAFVLPLDSLQAVAEAAGLQWVNSDADKIRAVKSAMDSEPQPAHVPRERRAPTVVDEGPLVLVETRKDLSQFKLPFETSSGASHPQV
jgi:ribonuclease E